MKKRRCVMILGNELLQSTTYRRENKKMKKTLNYDYFPSTWQAVVWRNWGYIPVERIAKAIEASEADIKQAAKELGLPDMEPDLTWLKRGYLTIIRNNWMICTNEQICTLLEMTEDKLDFILKEDDFFWIKLGSFKPEVEAPKYAPLTDEQKKRTEEIRKLFAGSFVADKTDNGFCFIENYTRPVEDGEVKAVSTGESKALNLIYPYFALFGDVLLDDDIDPFPEGLLQEYAKMGINGVWMQGILYQLVEFPFEPRLSEGWQKRRESLRKMAIRAKKYGIGIYLYFNEPRGMRPEFFEKYPHLKGQREGNLYAMCTSTKEVQDYIYEGMKSLFSDVKELAGFFTITRSENLTNCYSRVAKETECPRCSKRTVWEVVAEVNNLLAKGAHDGNPEAKAISWAWGWKDAYADKIVKLLTENQILQCTSEEAMPFCINGTKGNVLDYTMSLCGPGEKAKGLWEVGSACGLETSAKVQINNTWEMSAVPFIPVFDQIEKHINGLKEAGVKHLQSSWTLGGCPAPNLKLAKWLMDGKGDVKAFLQDYLGEKVGDKVYEAQKKLSEAFREFPFHIDVLYHAPQNFGPMSPFFLEKTNYTATMVGFPYDDIVTWKGIYDADTLEIQFLKLCEGWKVGMEMLQACEGKNQRADEITLMAKVCYCHFMSAYHHIAFVNAREKKEVQKQLALISAEKEVVSALIELRLQDSRIGYESSNHYFYSLQDLKEKLINLNWCERQLA